MTFFDKLSLGDKVKEDAMKKEAEEIYKGMAHLLSLRGVRVMAFLLIKVFKSLFRRVYVNEEGVHRVSAFGRAFCSEFGVIAESDAMSTNL